MLTDKRAALSEQGSALAQLRQLARACHACALAATRTTVVVDDGDPNAQLMLIGEAPGREEDLLARPFVGRSGKLITRLVEEETGLSREDYYIANVVKCHPPANRNPTRDEIARCRHLLLGQIELVHPMIIVTLGNVASQTLLGRREGIGELRGGRYLLGDARVVPTYHPAAALRGGARVTEAIREDLQICAQLLRSGNAR